MLKATVSYSKKVPVPDSEYSSQGYSLSLETEIPETTPSAIRQRLHETFDLVKTSVEQELANGHSTTGPDTGSKPVSGPAAKASNRQVKFITDLANERRITVSDLNSEIRRRFKVDGLYDLTKKQASELLDELNARKRVA